MLRTLLLFSVTLACIGLLPNPVFAGSVSLKTKAGKSVAVAFYGTYSRATCLAEALPRFEVFKKPVHGTLRKAIKTVKIAKKGHCLGKPIKAMYVYYVPNKGFRGMDSGKIGFTHHRYTEGAATKHVGTSFKVKVE